MNPTRLGLTANLCEELGLFALPHVQVVSGIGAEKFPVGSVHEPGHIAAVRAASGVPVQRNLDRGVGSDDVPAFVGMHEIASRIFAGTVAAAERVWSGQVDHAVCFAGGLHHANASSSAGFCVYNDVAGAAQWLLDHGAKRVACVDIDVHHGDGTESIFWNDPRVLTISIHESAHTLYPGTGHSQDIGGRGALGSAINVPVPAGTGDPGWLRAFTAVVPPALRAFQPDVLVTQHGCDTHRHDPLAHLNLTVDAQARAASILHDLAHELCQGRWVATGGGGYCISDVVPRSWTRLVSVAAHQELDWWQPLPAAWRQLSQDVSGQDAPRTLSDIPPGAQVLWTPWSAGVNPTDEVDRMVMATKQAAFPELGLDPWLD